MAGRAEGTPPVLGILMIDGLTTSLPGSIANSSSHGVRTEFFMVPGATVERVLGGDEALTPRLVSAAQALVQRGVSGITSNCGFLGLYQLAVAAAATVPVFLSSLLLVPLVAATLPSNRRVGILTYDAQLLSRRQFEGCGWSPERVSIAVAGVQDVPSWAVLSRADGEVDPRQMKHDLLAVARQLLASVPDVGAVVLECAAMCPFTRELQTELAMPVVDINSLVDLFLRSMNCPEYGTTVPRPNDPRICVARVAGTRGQNETMVVAAPQ